jgi:hypothetical protein
MLASKGQPYQTDVSLYHYYIMVVGLSGSVLCRRGACRVPVGQLHAFGFLGRSAPYLCVCMHNESMASMMCALHCTLLCWSS